MARKIDTSGWTKEELEQGFAIRRRGGKSVIKISLEEGTVEHLGRTNESHPGQHKLPGTKFGSRAERNKGLYERLSKRIGKKGKFEVSELKKKALETLPKEDIDSHASDLYIKKTEKSTKLLNNMKNKDSGLLKTFKDQQTGETWYEIPFANMEDDYKEKQKMEFEAKRDAKVKEIVARQRKQMADLKYNEKNRLASEAEKAYNKWEKHYRDNNVWSDEKIKAKNDKLLETSNKAREKYSKYAEEYYKRGNETRTWQDKVEKNDFERDAKLEKLKNERQNDYYKWHQDKWSDDYYGTYEEYEIKNAKIKEENPNDKYEQLESYYSMASKRNRLSGDTKNEDGSTNFGDKKWTGKNYTNDEFIEHLEDANWHTEKSLLLQANLTNAQMKYIKDNTTLSSYSVGPELTGKENVERMIKLAKAKFPKKRTKK